MSINDRQYGRRRFDLPWMSNTGLFLASLVGPRAIESISSWKLTIMDDIFYVKTIDFPFEIYVCGKIELLPLFKNKPHMLNDTMPACHIKMVFHTKTMCFTKLILLRRVGCLHVLALSCKGGCWGWDPHGGPRLLWRSWRGSPMTIISPYSPFCQQSPLPTMANVE